MFYLGPATKIVLVLVVAALLVVVVVLLPKWLVERELRALAAAGEPVKLVDLERPPVPPEENAATLLTEVAKEIDAVSAEIAPVLKSDQWQEGLLGDDQLMRIGSALAKHPDLFDKIDEASKRPAYRSSIDFRQNPHVVLARQSEASMAFRTVSRLLTARALVQMHREDAKGAVESSLVALRLVRLGDGEPTIIAMLVNVAVRTVALRDLGMAIRPGPVPDEVLARLDAELAPHDDPALFRHAIATERVIGLESLADQGFVAGTLFVPDYLQMIDVTLSTLPLPGNEATSAIDAVQPRFAFLGNVAQLFRPALTSARTAFDRLRAQVRATRILIALIRKNAERVEPVDLASLGLPPETTTDPFTGKPMIVKATDQGWLIYSVGANGADDGGDVGTGNDVGLAPPGWKGPRE